MSIGTAKESSLHRDLKAEYAGEGAELEAVVGAFVCDAVSGSGVVIEVQTGSFAPLRKKLGVLSADREVRVVHPVVMVKYIETYDTDGALLSRRKSPRKGSEWDVFKALVYAPELVTLPNISIYLALVEAVEVRVTDGKGSWRRGGVSIQDRRLAACIGTVELLVKKDYLRFAPFPKKDEWTAKDLAVKAKIRLNLAQKAVFVLCKTGVIKQTGKKGRAFLYAISRGRAKTQAKK